MESAAMTDAQPVESSSDIPKLDLEVRKLTLEIRKLEKENKSLELSRGLWHRLGANTALVTALITAASVAIGLYQFNRGQEASRAQLIEQSKREAAARAEELRKTYWQEQK